MQIKYLGGFPIARCQRLAQNAAMTENTGPSPIAPYPIAVIMERTRLANRWATERWEAKGVVPVFSVMRSEERRVGKECKSQCRSRWSPYH